MEDIQFICESSIITTVTFTYIWNNWKLFQQHWVSILRAPSLFVRQHPRQVRENRRWSSLSLSRGTRRKPEQASTNSCWGRISFSTSTAHKSLPHNRDNGACRPLVRMRFYTDSSVLSRCSVANKTVPLDLRPKLSMLSLVAEKHSWRLQWYTKRYR